MFTARKPSQTPPLPTYAWDDHPEAVLGIIYLYFSSNCDPQQISEQRLNAFVLQHQDENATLTNTQVVTAVQAVRGMDGRSGPRPCMTLVALWDALSPLRDRLPVQTVLYCQPTAPPDEAEKPPDVAALLAMFAQDR